MSICRSAVTLLLVAIVLAGPRTVCRALDLPQEISDANGYTIRIPGDWKVIPQTVLDHYSDQLAKIAPTAERQIYVHGFQLAASERWFTYPYIMVQTWEGRTSEAALEKMTDLKAVLDNGADKVEKSTSGILSGIAVGQPTYDSGAHIVWTRFSMNVAEKESVTSLMAFLLTEKGTVAIYGYAKADEYDQYAPLFEAVARGATIAPELQYKPRPATPAEDKVARVVGAAIGVLVVFFVIRRKRAMRPV